MNAEPAEKGDAHAIAWVHVQSWQTAYRGQLPDSLLDSLHPSHWEPMWTRLLTDPSHTILTLRSGLDVVGFCDFGRSRDDGSSDQTAELYAIYLLPQFWGGGHGSRLLNAALAGLEGKGYSEITCWVLQTNQRAIAFYQRHQLALDGEHKTEMWGEVELREVRMKKDSRTTMNWLAHLLLSEPTPAFRLGNVLPDLASAAELSAMPSEFQEGIRRHRLIDAYTDAHPVVRRSIERLGPSMRRFGGIIIDIAYDHFLARRWERFSTVPLPEFAADVYAGFAENWVVIPIDEQPRVAQMMVDNWLVSYRELPCIGAAIERIGKRLRRPVDLSPAYEVLQRDTALFEADFAEFFPQLTASVWPDYCPPDQY